MAELRLDRTQGVQILAFEQANRIRFRKAFAHRDLIVKIAQAAALSQKPHQLFLTRVPVRVQGILRPLSRRPGVSVARLRYLIVLTWPARQTSLEMLTALLLMLSPGATWDRVEEAKRGVLFVLFTHVLPLLVLVSAAEGYGLVYWGRVVGPLSRLKQFPLRETIVFESGQLMLALLVVGICAWMAKSSGETFHGRHSFAQAFGLVAYGFAPFFLFRASDAFPGISSWLSWGIGLLFTIGALYHGVPRVMQPDPAHAFGLFLVSSLLIALTTGLAQTLSWCYLQGKFPRVESLVSVLAARLPF